MNYDNLEASLIRKAWHAGDLRYKLKACQADMLQRITLSDRFKYFIKCSRRLGKSYLLVSLGAMACRRKDHALVRYAAPTKVALRKIIRPLIRTVTADCPPDIAPVWKQTDSMYLFPETKAEFHIAGVNNGHADDLRGTACDLFLVDEAGYVDDLHYLIHDVAMPQLLDPNGLVVAGRRLIVAGSPARTPSHMFKEMCDEAERDGYYSHFNIFAGEYPIEVIRKFLKEDGASDSDIDALLKGDYKAIKSTTILREYLALDVVDSDYALIPEWNDSFCQEFETDEFFPYYHKYDSLDIGVRDLSVALFAHYDFQRAKLFVHDEVTMNGPQMTTEKLAEAIREKEEDLWGVKWETFHHEGKTRYRAKNPPYFRIRRVSDKDLLLIQDISQIHGLYFEPTDKGYLEEMVNEVRIWVNQGRIVVHPRCKQLLGCLRYGVWNEQRRDFDRSLAYGHFDAMASLMYLIRNVDTRTNPIPVDHKRPADDWFFNEEPEKKKAKLKRMFNVR